MIEETILGDFAVEGHPVHPGAVWPGQREIEEVTNHCAALGSQVGGRHAFHPERQRVVDQLLGQCRVELHVAVQRPACLPLHGLSPDLMEQLLDVRLDPAGVQDGLGVELLEERPALGGVEHVLGLVHAELVEDGQELVLQDLTDPQLHAVLEDEVERLHRVLLADAVHTTDPLFDPHRVPRQVVVDHDVGELEVQALATGVRRDQDAGLLGEALLDPPPLRPGPSSR